MSFAIQFDMFQAPPTPEDIMKQEIEFIKDQQEKYRRSIFGKHGELIKLFLKQQEELDRLKVMLIDQKQEIERLKGERI